MLLLHLWKPMLLGLFKNVNGCMLDSPKVVYFWRILDGRGIKSEESAQLSLPQHSFKQLLVKVFISLSILIFLVFVLRACSYVILSNCSLQFYFLPFFFSMFLYYKKFEICTKKTWFRGQVKVGLVIKKFKNTSVTLITHTIRQWFLCF